jgi:hypothetical protein
MNKILHYVQNYNITGVVQQFNAQFFENYHSNFYGNINMAIYDRSIANQIHNKLQDLPFLEGFLPKLPNDEFMDEDFVLCPEIMLPYEMFFDCLKDIDGVVCFQICCSKHPVNGETVISLSRDKLSFC